MHLFCEEVQRLIDGIGLGSGRPWLPPSSGFSLNAHRSDPLGSGHL
jgi:hypothetical protein